MVKVAVVLACLLGCGKGGAGGGDAKHDAFVMREIVKAFGFTASACLYKVHGVQLTGSRKDERSGHEVVEAVVYGETLPPCAGSAGPHTWDVTWDMQQESTIGFKRHVRADNADVAPLYSSKTTKLDAKGLTDRTDATAALECPGKRLESTMKNKRFVFDNVPLPVSRALIVCELNAGDPRTTPVYLVPTADLSNIEVIVGAGNPPAAPSDQPTAAAGSDEEECMTAKLKEDTALRAEPSSDGFELTQLPACLEICRIRDERGFALVRASPRDTGYVVISAIGDAPACK